MLEQARQLLKAFDNQEEKWHQPFPMGVFGTLRLGCGNHYLMGNEQGKPPPQVEQFRYDRPPYQSHHKAFMPHFVAVGLSIHHNPGSSAVFEVFTYTPEDWSDMIGSVDSLEGFHPTSTQGYSYSYHRTLTWLHILPDDFESPHYEGTGLWGRGPRDLEIPKETWDQYERVPCWVYSSLHDNGLSRGLSDTPIIWCGDEVVVVEDAEDFL